VTSTGAGDEDDEVEGEGEEEGVTLKRIQHGRSSSSTTHPRAYSSSPIFIR
jgi:hypothetical protein